MLGATVFCRVSDELRGEFLQRMEHHGDIHILLWSRERNGWIYWLRSDRWGGNLEGFEMQAMVDRGRPGLSFAPVLTSRK